MDQQDVQRAVADLEEYQGEIDGIAADVTDKSLVEEAVEFTIDRFGSLDILINNAGITADAQVLKMEEAQWDNVIDVNLKGVFLMSQAAASRMKEQKSGVILNASSVVSLYGILGRPIMWLPNPASMG